MLRAGPHKPSRQLAVMREARFVDHGRPRWAALEDLLARVDRRGLRRLDADDLDALALGYRAATSDLAVARARSYDARLVAYLNRLVGRAHARVYAGTSAGGWTKAIGLFARDFPREVRRSWQAIALCVLITAVTAALSYRATRADPVNAYAFVPASEVPLVERSLHDSNFGFDRAFAPAMSTMIITNNVKVAALAFAGGITAGILTLYIVGSNGLMLGTLGALFAQRGFGADFWATIAPHGVIELFAIQVSGGAGLILAAGIVRPGRARRVDALRANALRALTLVIGVAGMLVVAGTIEGFVSPQRLSIDVRLAIGALTAIALGGYFTFAGRGLKSAYGTTACGRRRGIPRGRRPNV
jgi:uncharacterized membrane protein SpoIIM required for sporulation